MSDAPAQGPLPVALTREQIERSPDVDTQEPVSRQYEIAHSLRVVEAAADAKAKGIGAFTVNVKMIDGPFIR